MENRWLFCSEWFKAMKIMKVNISKILGYLVFTFRSNTTLESRWQESLFQWTKLQVQSVPQYYNHHTPHCPETLKMKRTLQLSLTLCSNTLRSSTRFWWWWRKLMGRGGSSGNFRSVLRVSVYDTTFPKWMKGTNHIQNTIVC